MREGGALALARARAPQQQHRLLRRGARQRLEEGRAAAAHEPLGEDQHGARRGVRPEVIEVVVQRQVGLVAGADEAREADGRVLAGLMPEREAEVAARRQEGQAAGAEGDGAQVEPRRGAVDVHAVRADEARAARARRLDQRPLEQAPLFSVLGEAGGVDDGERDAAPGHLAHGGQHLRSGPHDEGQVDRPLRLVERRQEAVAEEVPAFRAHRVDAPPVPPFDQRGEQDGAVLAGGPRGPQHRHAARVQKPRERVPRVRSLCHHGPRPALRPKAERHRGRPAGWLRCPRRCAAPTRSRCPPARAPAAGCRG